MTVVIIEPKSPDVYGIIYPLEMYARPLLICKETGRTVVVLMHDYAVEFDKSFVIRRL